jgi:hypothetical protein
MLKRLALGTLLATALVAPAFAFNPQPDPPGKHPDTDVLLANGSTIHISADGRHVTELKGGKQVPLPAGEYKLKNGVIMRVGALGGFTTLNIGSQSGGAGAGK